MRITIPADIPAEHAEPYRRGFKDGIRRIGAKGGSSTSPAKAAASAENGRKGGRPRKDKA
jgi:hypothetical protein